MAIAVPSGTAGGLRSPISPAQPGESGSSYCPWVWIVAIGWLIGFAVSDLGCTLSYLADLPTGATVVCTFGLELLLVGLGYAALRSRG